MNTKVRTGTKNYFEKDLKLLHNSIFGKTTKNVRKDRNIKLVITDKSRSYLGSKPNYHTTKRLSEDLLEMKRNMQK